MRVWVSRHLHIILIRTNAHLAGQPDDAAVADSFGHLPLVIVVCRTGVIDLLFHARGDVSTTIVNEI